MTASRVSRAAATRYLIEGLVAAALFAWSAWWATAYQRRAAADGVKGSFYQSYFEPSVMLACGRGFVLAQPQQPLPALRAFLETRADSFDCNSLPPTLETTTTGLFYSWFYLMIAVAFTWKLIGVSWSALMLLLSALFGVVVVLAYGLFRLAIGRTLSAASAFLVSVSTLHLTNLPNLRDYAKAPFVLALILLLGWLVTGRASVRRVLILCGLYGVILGIGYGFRTDLLINVPPLPITVFGFLRGGPLQNIRLKVAATALCALLFVVTAWPVVRYVTTHGGCQWHVAFLGLMTPFDEAVGVVPASYDWGQNYADTYVHASLGGFPRRGSDGAAGPHYCGPEYDAITRRYFFGLVKMFPADFVTRAYASVLRISNLPFDWRRAPLPEYQGRFYNRRGQWLEHWSGIGPMLVAIACALIAAADLRLGLWALFALLFFGGYPMLQFHPRHHFHLEWVGWFAAALPVSMLARGAGLMLRLPARGTGSGTPAISRELVRAIAFRLLVWSVVAWAATWGALQILRAYQRHRVQGVLDAMIADTSDRVATVDGPGAARRLLTMPAESSLLAPDRRGPFWGELLRIEADAAACGSPSALTLRYDPRDPNRNFTRTIWLDGAASKVTNVPDVTNVTILAPVFQRFVGIEVASNAPGCVLAVYHPKNVATIPVWLFAVLPHDRARMTLFQSIEPSLVEVFDRQQ